VTDDIRVVLAVRVLPKVRDQIDMMAKARGVTRTEMIKLILTAGWTRVPAPKAKP